MHMPPRLIQISGTLGSGKDSVGDMLAEKYGYQHVSAGDVLRTEARAQGYTDPIPREVLGKIGDHLAHTHGPGPITRGALKQYEQVADQFPGGLAISGIRRVEEAKAAKAHDGFILFTDAPETVRFKHVQARGRGDDGTSLEDFIAREQQELHGTTADGKDGIYILGVKALADAVIVNETGTFDELYAKAQKALGL
jgi:dephospho-CoA kinase